eukprot:Hpha_TRINITY_DN14817_c0_g1::TRINITY_DN14817_c0_g1_i1::g.170383::m.170383
MVYSPSAVIVRPPSPPPQPPEGLAGQEGCCLSEACRNALQRRRAEVAEARELLSRRHAQMLECEGRVSALERQREKLRKELRGEQKERERITQRAEELERELEESRRRCVDATEQEGLVTSRLRAEQAEKEQEWSSSAADMQAQISSLWAVIEERDCKLKQQITRRQMAEGECADLQQRLKEKGEGNKALVEALNLRGQECAAKMEQERGIYAEAVRRLRGEAEHREDLITQLRRSVVAAGEERDKATGEMNSILEELERAREESGALRRELEVLNADAEERLLTLKANHSTALKQAIERVQQEQRLRQTQEASAEAAGNALTREREARQQAASALYRHTEEMRAKEVETRKDKDSWRKREEELKGQIVVLAEDINERDARLSAQERSFRDLLDRKEDSILAAEDRIQSMKEAGWGGGDEENEMYLRRRATREALALSLSDALWLRSAVGAAGTSAGISLVVGNQEPAEEQDARIRGNREERIAERVRDALAETVTALQGRLARSSHAADGDVETEGDGCTVM